MKVMKGTFLRTGMRWGVLLVLALGLLLPGAGAAPQGARPQYAEIVGDVTWDSNFNPLTDVVVTDGASLTIKAITVTADSLDLFGPYPQGLSPKIEIIVESGGLLIVEEGATLTAAVPGDWYGVVFLPGSQGNITGAEISHGTVGITIYEAAPTIALSSIHDMQGDDGVVPGDPGGLGAGIVISGTRSARRTCCTSSD